MKLLKETKPVRDFLAKEISLRKSALLNWRASDKVLQIPRKALRKLLIPSRSFCIGEEM